MSWTFEGETTLPLFRDAFDASTRTDFKDLRYRDETGKTGWRDQQEVARYVDAQIAAYEEDPEIGAWGWRSGDELTYKAVIAVPDSRWQEAHFKQESFADAHGTDAMAAADYYATLIVPLDGDTAEEVVDRYTTSAQIDDSGFWDFLRR